MAIEIIPNPTPKAKIKKNAKKKGLGYLWPEIPPVIANRIRALAKANGYTGKDGPKIIANQLIRQALGELTAKPKTETPTE